MERNKIINSWVSSSSEKYMNVSNVVGIYINKIGVESVNIDLPINSEGNSQQKWRRWTI